MHHQPPSQRVLLAKARECWNSNSATRKTASPCCTPSYQHVILGGTVVNAAIEPAGFHEFRLDSKHNLPLPCVLKLGWKQFARGH